MSVSRSCSLCVFLLTQLSPVVFGDTLNVTGADVTDTPGQTPAPSLLLSSLLFKPGVSDSISLLSSFPEDLEISDHCKQMLLLFGQRYVAYANCLVPAARPVKVCQSCYASYGSLNETFNNISSQTGPGNESCRDSLLRSDRLMLVYLLFNNLKDLWRKSACDDCIAPRAQSLTNDTLYFLATLNTTLSCFERHQTGNHSELCETCKASYKELNELYGGMEKNQTLCIDLEDAMNGTRILWSKNFNCSLTREETVAVIAVSSFMLFLPIIFYLSSFLHSEQKKRKLIHPKRAKSYASLMNIQDKQS